MNMFWKRLPQQKAIFLKNREVTRRISNFRNMDTQMTGFFHVTGIKERRISNGGENTSALCTNVATKLLASRGLAPDELDYHSSDHHSGLNTTRSACQVKGILAHQAFAFDISAACAGGICLALSVENKKKIGFGPVLKKGTSLAVKCCKRSWMGRSFNRSLLETGQAGCFRSNQPSASLEGIAAVDGTEDSL